MDWVPCANLIDGMISNAIVEYVNERGEVVGVDRFYDPGLDPASSYWRDMKLPRPVLVYQCGAPFHARLP